MGDSNAELYGSGVFTTVHFTSGKPFLWEKHWHRLSRNADALGIERTDITSSDLRELIEDSIFLSGLSSGRVRIALQDERRSPFWHDSGSESSPAKINVIVGEQRPTNPHLKLTISPDSINSRSPLAGVKSCNYLEPLLSLNEAKSRGFHEAIRLNEKDIVTSGCMANVFWLKDGGLFTPSLSTGCLAGSTREFVLENLACREVEAEMNELESADAVFLTSAGIGIVRADEFDGRKLAGQSHPILGIWPF